MRILDLATKQAPKQTPRDIYVILGADLLDAVRDPAIVDSVVAWIEDEWGGQRPYVHGSQVWPGGFLSELGVEVAKQAILVGDLDPMEALVVAARAQQVIRARWGKQYLYFPLKNLKTLIDSLIYREFNGRNLCEVVRKFRVTGRGVYQAIHRERDRRGIKKAS